MPLNVHITVHGDKKLGQFKPIYRFFGCDEPNYVYMKDGEKLIRKLGELGSDQVYFRVHNQFTTGKGVHALKWGSTNVYTEDEHGSPIYDWTIIDKIYDTWLSRNVKPYVQFGFMPEAMSTNPQPYQHSWTPTASYKEVFTGWTYPPKDYEKWGELVYQWTKHVVDKYGKAEAESWYWETWNEPNIGYWQGTHEEFCKLYDYTVENVRKALPTAFVGGPETADGGPDYLRKFFEHCLRGQNFVTGKTGSPLDFTSFHAKGKPEFIEHSQHVRMNVGRQLRIIDESFGVIAEFPELKDKPIVIGESDPEGAAAAQGPQLGYRNGTMYSSYTAASFIRKQDLAAKKGVNLEGALTWAFEFENQPYFAGFRVLATNNIDLPVLNVFRMFAKMGGSRLETKSDAQIPLESILENSVRERPDIGAATTLNEGKLSIFVWHYHDDDLPGEAAKVEISLQGLKWNPAHGGKMRHYRIDEHHSNAYTKWKSLGSPQQPSKEEYKQLSEAAKLATLEEEETEIGTRGPGTTLSFSLPRQGVSLLLLEGVSGG
ncbi:uncharacterized protein Z519_01734 [Cladophialophora bantiana CBS 173.52]|uniref:Glycosyl hydrolases family 39 N-terminal catalytic domain-containing protein n=1 Tax=Cladophialophora bantiana (strain ATCC 10958 / CBS 173.52 / CDC B-1940 / NIH 8579) TaxID=1442370 RepID=A0A0D2I4G6_CLAB1|nr:uncharacterized protein Z519_01734 [Cladophialophora bantiana CBS 173.52]KIW98150.1 hypothetical protein Z519_01734 [Cladophialophora bantiana CBS 173.52]